MTQRPTSLPAVLAMVGIISIVGLVPFLPGRLTLGSYSFDSVVAVVALCLLVCVPLLTRSGASGFPRSGVEISVLAFLGWVALSLIFAGPTPSAVLTWGRYASYALLIAVVGAVSAAPTGRRIVLWAVALSSSVTVVVAFRQYLRPITGIGMEGLDATVATRVFSTYENPNFYAEFLVLAFAATLALMISERRWLRYIAGVMLFSQATVLLLTYTRGSWLALAAGLVVATMMIDLRLVLPLVAGGAVLLPLVPGAMARALSVFSLEGTSSFRLSVWEIAGLSIQERPLFGAGVGRFYDAFRDTVLSHPELGIGYLFYGAHNSYFQLAAETGIIGGLLFAWMVFEMVRMGLYYNTRMTRRGVRLQNAALTAGLVAFALNALTSNAFQHPRAAVFFFVLVGVQAGLGAPWRDAPLVEHPARRSRSPVLAGSLVVRAYRRVTDAAGGAWGTSLVRRFLMRRPAYSDGLVSGSILARAILGPGRETEDGPDAGSTR